MPKSEYGRIRVCQGNECERRTGEKTKLTKEETVDTHTDSVWGRVKASVRR